MTQPPWPNRTNETISSDLLRFGVAIGVLALEIDRQDLSPVQAIATLQKHLVRVHNTLRTMDTL